MSKKTMMTLKDSVGSYFANARYLGTCLKTHKETQLCEGEYNSLRQPLGGATLWAYALRSFFWR